MPGESESVTFCPIVVPQFYPSFHTHEFSLNTTRRVMASDAVYDRVDQQIPAVWGQIRKMNFIVQCCQKAMKPAEIGA